VETDRSDSGRRTVYALLAVGFYAAHAVTLLRIGLAANLLWSCHLACVLLAAGILLRVPVLSAVALLWLALGLPLWIWSVFSGSGFHPTSTLTHVGGLLLAISTALRRGFPRGAWWRASVGLVLLWALSRIALPAHTNVNLSRTFWFGWEREYVGYPVFLGVVLLLATAAFVGVEALFRRANRLKRT